MRIWEHTFAELTGAKNPVSDNDNVGDFEMSFHPQSIVPITDKPGYGTALMKRGTLADPVLVEFKEGQWVYAGHYEGDTLMLRPSARRKGLGEELILRATEHRNSLPLTSAFTKAGYSLLRRTHRLAVSRAILAGLPVPKKVLDEYGS